MKEIILTQGQFAIVDDEDFDRLNAYKWCVKFDKGTGTYYVLRHSSRKNDLEGKQHSIYMHRIILNAQVGQHVDHINHDTLDNRKSNLRICTHSQNQMNGKKPNTNTSGYKGVSFHKPSQKFVARMRFNKKMIHLGNFNNPVQAAKMYDFWARDIYGEFAQTNF